MVLKMQKIGKSINSIHLRAYPAYKTQATNIITAVHVNALSSLANTLLPTNLGISISNIHALLMVLYNICGPENLIQNDRWGDMKPRGTARFNTTA